MSKPNFDTENPTIEAQHWTSLSLSHARRIAREHFTDQELKDRPEIVLEIAKMIMNFVSAKESTSDFEAETAIASILMENS